MRLVIAFAALLAASCQKAPTGQESDVDALATSILWPTNTLRVCFDGPVQSPQLGDLRPIEQRIAAAVQRNYRAETTGIHFTGFFDCDKGASDVVIGWITDAQYPAFGISSHLGMIDGRHYPSFAGQVAVDLFKNIDRPTVAIWTQAFADSAKMSTNGATAADAAAATVLHELGHIAGLFHEHAAPDSTCHPGTAEASSQRTTDFPDIADRTYIPFGKFDPYSIMSYCSGMQELGLNLFQPDPSLDPRLFPPPSQIGLSAVDVAALAAMYGVGTTSSAQTGSVTPPQQPQQPQPQQAQPLQPQTQSASAAGLPPGACQVTFDTPAKFCLACGSSSQSCASPLSRQMDTLHDCHYDAHAVTCSNGSSTLTLTYR